MKKILFTIGLILICYLGYGQSNPYPINQNIGGPATAVKTPPSGAFYGGLIPYSFLDTSSANTALQYLKTYNGALIYTTSDSALYFRTANGNKWQQILPSGGSTGANAWLVNGNPDPMVSDVSGNVGFGPLGNRGVKFFTNGTTRLILDKAGIGAETGTTIGLGYDPSNGNIITQFSGSGSTPTWQQTLVAGSTLTQNNTIDGGNFIFHLDSASQIYLNTKLNSTRRSSISLLASGLSSTYEEGALTSSLALTSNTVTSSNSAGYSFVVGESGYSFAGLTNASSQNRLIGQTSSNGLINYITLGTGLSLSGGSLSVTTGAPYWPLNGATDFTGNVQIDMKSNQLSLLGDVNTNDVLFNINGATGDWLIGDAPNAIASISAIWSSNTIQITADEVLIQDGSLGTASAGYVWTLQNTGTGEGAWAAAASSGANTALSNLASVAINTTLLPSSAYSTSVGSNSKPFLNIYGNWLYGGDMTTTYGGYSGAILGGTGAHAVLDFVDNGTRIAELYTSSTAANFYTKASAAFNFFTNNSLSTAVLTLSGGQNALIGGSTDPASAVSALGIFNGTAPTGSITNGTILYSEDVAASSELKVRDEAGNITVLSPHNFSKLGKPSEDLAWSYYSEKDGKYITVDMTKAIRTIEELTQRVYELEKKLDLTPKKPVKLLYKGKVKK